MKQVSVVLLLSFAQLFCCARAQYCVEFVLITDTCCGHSNVANFPTNVRVEGRGKNSNSWRALLRNPMDVEKSDTQLCNKTAISDTFAAVMASPTLHTRQRSFPSDFEVGDGEGIELRFIQTNHRGGYCDCWGLACDILLLNSSGHIVNTIKKQQIIIHDVSENSTSGEASSGSTTAMASGNDNITGSGSLGSGSSASQPVIDCLPPYVCGGSASLERGFITGFTHPDRPSCNHHSSDSFTVITEQKKHNIQMNEECKAEDPYLKIMFTYTFRSLDSFDEGFELSFRNNENGGGTWIPIWFFSATESSVRTVHDINLGSITDDGLLILRGYPVNSTVSENLSKTNIKLCGPGVFNNQTAKGLFNWQFRWLQTVANDSMNSMDEDDVIYIYNVSIMVNDTQQLLLFQDDFSTEGKNLSSEKWSTPIRDVKQQQNCGGLNDSCLEFSSSTGNPPDCAKSITSREVSTVCLNSITKIQYTLITASSSDCPGNGTLMSKFQFPQLQYQWKNSNWMNIDFDHGDPAVSIVRKLNASNSNIMRYDMTIVLRDQITGRRLQIELDQCTFNHLRFRFIQREHRGGFCDCWAVANLTATLTSGEERNLRRSCGQNLTLIDLFNAEEVTDPEGEDDNVIAGFCRDSASETRIFQTQSGSEYTEEKETCSITNNSPYETDCSGLTDPKIEVEFDLTFFEYPDCGEIEDFSEGVELSIKRNGGDWIPLMFIAPRVNATQPYITLSRSTENRLNGSYVLRGYTIPYVIQAKSASVSLCNDQNQIFTDKLQFRWLQTSYQSNQSDRDVVMLKNIIVTARKCLNSVILLHSSINDSLLLDATLTYNVHSQPPPNSNCGNSSNKALYFYQNDSMDFRSFGGENYTITSRQAVTREINLKALIPPDRDLPSTICHQLLDLLKYVDMQELVVTAYNLSSILRDVGNQTVDLEFSELVLSLTNRLLDIAQNNFKGGIRNSSLDDFTAGSTLLRILEDFALNNHDAVHSLVQNDNIILRVKEVSNNSTDESISLIEGENARISIPREVIASVKGRESVRVVSFLYRNMSGLLPESLEGVEMNDGLILRLASPVISISPQCDGINCTTSNLSTPVEATFTHTPYDVALLQDDEFEEINMTCVFWKFEQLPDSFLSRGQWSTEGCETNSTTPNSTVCHCNHLTHFAILLSARPLNLPQAQILALQITGYIGVSVSLVAMAATIFVFVFLKPLRTMRNYIHIQLCVTLGIAQIIFVAGVEPRLGEGGEVPIGCRSVAVLLHYWFLASFMWMLMEGVVLYVELVRVFVTYHARYIAAFTISSYGLPLLYMGALTLPLGFVRTEHYREYRPYDYGYEQACYLSPHTSFVWSLLAPVILIFLANIGFFIMAIVIMYRHQKRQHTDKKTHEIKQWIKACISLTVVMGITWIIGFLVIKVEELFTLAYIFTIFVAFQGVFIFVIFVLLSKQVKENYAKWWKAKVAESDFLSKHFGDRTLGTSLSAQNKTPIVTPLYDKIDRKSPNTASKGYHLEAEQSRAIEIENSYSQHKLPTAPQNSESCDDESHRSFVIGGGATPQLGATPLTENDFDMASSQNRTPTPSYDKIDQESSSTTSKEDLGQSRATEIENSSSHQKPLSTVPLNSCDNKSHRKTDDDIGATPPTENFTFNIIYLPRSIPTDSTTRTPPPDNNPLTDTKDKDSEGSSSTMEEVELSTKRATPNDYVLTNSFICDQLTEDERSTKL